jgi:hypothetical protein
MRDLFREYWPWIVTPIVLGLAIVVALVFLVGSDDTSPFIYQIR